MPVRACEASKRGPNTAKMAVVLTGKMPVLRETSFSTGCQPARQARLRGLIVPIVPDGIDGECLLRRMGILRRVVLEDAVIELAVIDQELDILGCLSAGLGGFGGRRK